MYMFFNLNGPNLWTLYSTLHCIIKFINRNSIALETDLCLFNCAYIPDIQLIILELILMINYVKYGKRFLLKNETL